jgi:biotin carboxyl carrier protein
VALAMRYHVLLGADPAGECAVDLINLPNGLVEARIDGQTIELDIVSVGAALNVRVGATVVDLTMYGAPPEVDVTARGYRSRARVESERMRLTGRLGNAAESHGEKVIKSPMPGRVVKVLVAQGETVRAGQGVVVLEAMKMENEVRARSGGTVAKVHVAPGAAVEGSAILVTFA